MTGSSIMVVGGVAIFVLGFMLISSKRKIPLARLWSGRTMIALGVLTLALSNIPHG